jgi:hypothetical protein
MAEARNHDVAHSKAFHSEVHAALAEFRRDVPDFLSRSEGGVPEGRVDRLPVSDDVSIPVQANLIIELCSK